MHFCRPVSNLLRTAAFMAAASSAYAGEISVEQPYSIHEPSSIQQTSTNQQSQVADVSTHYRARTASGYVVPSDPGAELLPTTLVIAMLVAYQLRRKHRFLRPRPFSL